MSLRFRIVIMNNTHPTLQLSKLHVQTCNLRWFEEMREPCPQNELYQHFSDNNNIHTTSHIIIRAALAKLF